MTRGFAPLGLPKCAFVEVTTQVTAGVARASTPLGVGRGSRRTPPRVRGPASAYGTVHDRTRSDNLAGAPYALHAVLRWVARPEVETRLRVCSGRGLRRAKRWTQVRSLREANDTA